MSKKPPYRLTEAPEQPRRLLLAGQQREYLHRVHEQLQAEGYLVTRAPNFEATLEILKEDAVFDVWVLDAETLQLGEPLVWASLRYACDRPRERERFDMTLPAPRVPVLVLVNRDQPDAMKALSAAAASPSITGWNRHGWALGVLEVPAPKGRMDAILRALIDQSEENEGVPGVPQLDRQPA